MREEVARKKDLLASMKDQREQTEMEASHIFTELENKKENEDKLAKLTRESARKEAVARDLRSANEQLRAVEKK